MYANLTNMKTNWILNNGSQKIDCASFPYAFRTAFNIVRKTIDAKLDPTKVINGLSIVGPPNSRGERKTYDYAAATQMATDQGLLTPEGNIRGAEFKKL